MSNATDRSQIGRRSHDVRSDNLRRRASTEFGRTLCLKDKVIGRNVDEQESSDVNRKNGAPRVFSMKGKDDGTRHMLHNSRIVSFGRAFSRCSRLPTDTPGQQEYIQMMDSAPCASSMCIRSPISMRRSRNPSRRRQFLS